jgi:hypothetical protein
LGLNGPALIQSITAVRTGKFTRSSDFGFSGM